MSLIACALIGLIVGAFADRFFVENAPGVRVDATVAMVGALGGGGFVVFVDAVALDVLSLWRAIIAVISAGAALVLYRSFATREGPGLH